MQVLLRLLKKKVIELRFTRNYITFQYWEKFLLVEKSEVITEHALAWNKRKILKLAEIFTKDSDR